jgi:hypothetical protein
MKRLTEALELDPAGTYHVTVQVEERNSQVLPHSQNWRRY